MCRNSIITLLTIIWIHESCAFASPKSISVCFEKGVGQKNDSWCQQYLILCDDASFAYNMSVAIRSSPNNGNSYSCDNCQLKSTDSPNNSYPEVLSTCKEKCNCSLDHVPVPSTQHGSGILTLTFVCNNTDNDEGADNSTTTDGENKTLPTSSPVTTTSILTTMNSNTLTEDSVSSTGNNTTTAGTAHVYSDDDKRADNSTTTYGENKTLPTSSPVTTTSILTTINSNTLTEDSVSSTGKNTTIAGPAHLSTDSLTTAIVVSVVIPAIIAVVVVAVMMYRRGKCKLWFVKCMKIYDQHTDTADAYAMSSRANVNLTYDLSRGVDVNVCDLDYCEIDKVGKETDVEYSHVNLEKKQAVQDPTYNHIGHFNIAPGKSEQTYNHVGDVTLRITESSTLQPDTYSHIGAMTKPASEQLTDDSYAHINGVMKYTPEANDINPYDCAVLETNCGPTEGFGHQECKMNSGKEKKFYVVGPSKVDVNNEDPVSHSYFTLEKHEKEA